MIGEMWGEAEGTTWRATAYIQHRNLGGFHDKLTLMERFKKWMCKAPCRPN